LRDLKPEDGASITDVANIKAVNMDDPPITVGKVYLVYGIVLRMGNLWYDLMTEHSTRYTLSILAVFFDTIDHRLSEHWRLHVEGNGDFQIRPHSWTENPYYHEAVSDGDADAVEDFLRVRGRIEAEDAQREANDLTERLNSGEER